MTNATKLPEGVFHLLTADSTVGHPFFGNYVTVCGEGVPASDLPPSCYDDDCDVVRNPAYCPECVREAARWNAQPEQA